MANNVDLVVGNIHHGLWSDVTDTHGACLGGTALWVKAVTSPNQAPKPRTVLEGADDLVRSGSI
jgi:hypothetical protein